MTMLVIKTVVVLATNHPQHHRRHHHRVPLNNAPLDNAGEKKRETKRHRNVRSYSVVNTVKIKTIKNYKILYAYRCSGGFVYKRRVNYVRQPKRTSAAGHEKRGAHV